MNEAPSDHRKIEWWLWIGLVLAPMIFFWFLLRKGFSKRARLLGGAWLILGLIVWLVRDGPTVRDYFFPQPPSCDPTDSQFCRQLKDAIR